MRIPASQLTRDLSFLNGNTPLVKTREDDNMEVVIRTQFTLDGPTLDNISANTVKDPTYWKAIAAALEDLGEAVGNSKEFRYDVEKNTLFGYGEATNGTLSVQASAQLVEKDANL